MKYRILSHTADLRLEVYGKSLEELFENGAEAIAQILSPKAAKFEIKNQKSKIKIKVESNNLNALLVDFLNEILAKSQINKMVYKVHKVIKLKDTEVEVELVGYPIKEFEEDIKAVTYHEVDIKKEKNIWHTKLVLDI